MCSHAAPLAVLQSPGKARTPRGVCLQQHGPAQPCWSAAQPMRAAAPQPLQARLASAHSTAPFRLPCRFTKHKDEEEHGHYSIYDFHNARVGAVCCTGSASMCAVGLGCALQICGVGRGCYSAHAVQNG